MTIASGIIQYQLGTAPLTGCLFFILWLNRLMLYFDAQGDFKSMNKGGKNV